MSDNQKPKINVIRGKKKRTDEQHSSRNTSSGAELPGAMELATGLARGARTLWLAGLGALSVAEEAGSQVFDALVEEGKSWEQQRRERTERTARQVQQLTEEGTDAVEAAEERVREEVNDVLQRIGVPHRTDIDDLRDQVNDLAERMDRLADAISEEQEAGDA